MPDIARLAGIAAWLLGSASLLMLDVSAGNRGDLPAGTAYVEPLPAGAIARMGATRFRGGGQLYGIRLSPDGRILTTLNMAGTLRVWDVPTGRLVMQLVHYTRPKRGETFHVPVALSHDAQVLAIAEEGTIVLREARTGKQQDWKPELVRRDRIGALAYSSDDTVLIAVYPDETLAFSVASGERLDEFEVPAALAIEPLTRAEIQRSEAGRAVDNYWHRNALRSPEFRGLEYLSLSADRSLLAAASLMHGNRVRLFKLTPDGAGAIRVREHLPDDGHRAGITGLQFLGSGGMLLSSGIDDTACIWNVAGRRRRARIEKAYDASASDDGRLLAVLGLNATQVRLYNIAMSDDPRLLSERQGMAAAAVSPEGNLLAYMEVGRPTAVLVEEIATGEIVQRIGVGRSSASALEFSNDGEWIARAHSFPVLYGVDSGGRRMAATSGSGHLMILSPDARRLVTRSGGSIQLWSTAAGRLARRFGEGVKLRCGAVMRDNRRLIGGCQDGKIRVWDLQTGGLLATFPGHRRYVTAVALSPDETTFASGSIDSEILLWDAKRIPTP